MRVSKDQSPSVKLFQPGKTSRLGRGAAVVATILALGACDAADKRAVGTVGHIKGFGGLIAADEPRAVIIGRDVLSAGGSAADAATAMYFALAVTYPSAASLGGGGSCIVHDPVKKKTEVMEFPAIASTVAGQIPTGVPANPRGFFALHAKYGKLRHESLLVEAERLARTGFPVSRALAADLARAVPILGRDPAARAIFFRPDGSILREGDILAQPNLAAVISNLRRNTGDFYQGIVARELVKSVQAAGGSLSLEDLRDIRASWRDPIAVKVGNETAYFAPPPSVGSTMSAQLTAALWGRWRDTPAADRPHLMAEASARAFAERARWMNPNGWSPVDPAELVAEPRIQAMLADYSPDRHNPVTGVSAPPGDSSLAAGFAAMDSKGMGVACAVTTYGLFGVGRVAPGTGIVLAGAPGPNGPPSLTTMLSLNTHSNEIHFAGAASGGGTAPSALVQTFLVATADDKPLAEALATPRVVQPGMPDVAFVETGAISVDPEPLRQRGHQVNPVAMPSRVSAVHCPKGYRDAETCEAAIDPRGFGMATMVGKP
ncbi:gamma-glutamyltransferase [Paramagnetospirillum marisnigri]|uniref:Gamma-glutamyltransferase n=1 Tax=Paramagnetospirillum marisnigri TaxID=1285242 RepID=A0A178M4Q5_9PROT|nr:gamma-glutamyltransferase [Paramagnetospirillum marisnigri]OAN43046.1 gamma-glutamyltransferase [Paramagnetospirillum marisnigri]